MHEKLLERDLELFAVLQVAWNRHFLADFGGAQR